MTFWRSTAFALVHNNPDDLSDASWWCGTVYHIIVGWMGKIVLLDKSRGR
jgi:hypothetical protein